MDITLAWMATLVIFGTLAVLGCIIAHLVRLDWRLARVTKRQVATILWRWVLPIHLVFVITIIAGWLQEPVWWPPHGPNLVSLVIPSAATGVADAILTVVLVCVWPSRVTSKP